MPSRRTVLASSACVLVGGLHSTVAGAVPGMDDENDCDEETEIPVLISDDEVVKSESVPKAWDEHREYVKNVREEFDDEYPVGETDWIRWTGITSTDAEVCDMGQLAISVGV